MCRLCGRSFDRHCAERTIYDVAVWAADRARTAERRRVKKEPPPVRKVPRPGRILEEFASVQPDPLHPTGRCTCAGEGRCEWCRRVGNVLDEETGRG